MGTTVATESGNPSPQSTRLWKSPAWQSPPLPGIAARIVPWGIAASCGDDGGLAFDDCRVMSVCCTIAVASTATHCRRRGSDQMESGGLQESLKRRISLMKRRLWNDAEPRSHEMLGGCTLAIAMNKATVCVPIWACALNKGDWRVAHSALRHLPLRLTCGIVTLVPDVFSERFAPPNCSLSGFRGQVSCPTALVCRPRSSLKLAVGSAGCNVAMSASPCHRQGIDVAYRRWS